MGDETADGTEVGDLSAPVDEAGEAGEETPPEAPEWVPPYVIDVDLPIDVSIALDELVASVQQFSSTSRSFLDGDHLEVADIAQRLGPVGAPDDFPVTEEDLAAWQATVDGRTRGLGDLMDLVDEDRRLVRAYSDRMGEIFASAPPPPEPPPPPAPPEEDQAQDDEPASTPV